MRHDVESQMSWFIVVFFRKCKGSNVLSENKYYLRGPVPEHSVCTLFINDSIVLIWIDTFLNSKLLVLVVLISSAALNASSSSPSTTMRRRGDEEEEIDYYDTTIQFLTALPRLRLGYVDRHSI